MILKRVLALLLLVTMAGSFAAPQSALALFPPDEATRPALARLDGKAPSGMSFLRSVVDRYNEAGNVTLPRVAIQEVQALPGGLGAEMGYQFVDGRVVIEIRMTPEGAKNPVVVAEQLARLMQIDHSNRLAFFLQFPGSADGFNSYSQWLETVWNVKAGDAQAKKLLAEMDQKAHWVARVLLDLPSTRAALGYASEEVGVPETIKDAMNEVMRAREAHAEARVRAATQEAKKQASTAQKTWKKRKEAFKALEAQQDKLNDLVARNDRKGVRDLLEKYIPWDLMAPSERVMWTHWLEAIERPDPSRARIMFRGMDDDLIMRAPEGKVYTLSKVLTKNMGNYTQRLRSLETSRDKIAKKFQYPGEPALEYLFRAHSQEPYASQFLSYSSDPVTALSFGKKKIVIAKVDERRLVPNIFSNYGGEFEYLAPLILFPDEVLEYQELDKKYHLELPSASPKELVEERMDAMKRHADEYLVKAWRTLEMPPFEDRQAHREWRANRLESHIREGERWLHTLLSVDPASAPKTPVTQDGCKDVLKHALEALAK